jgi:hypothetical protein
MQLCLQEVSSLCLVQLLVKHANLNIMNKKLKKASKKHKHGYDSSSGDSNLLDVLGLVVQGN